MRSLTIGFSAKCLVNIVDQQRNNNNYFDYSKPEVEKELRFSKNVEYVAISGSSFIGSSFSNPFFTYQDHISIKGKFNKDKTMIEFVEVVYVYNQFSGDAKLSYTSESKHIKFKMYNLIADRNKNAYSIFLSANGKLSIEDYYTYYFNWRTHNRSETYSESLMKVLDSPIKPNGSVTLGSPSVEPKTPVVSVRVSVSETPQSPKERGLSRGYGALIYAHLSKIPNLDIYEGISSSNIMNEIQLAESDLLDEDHNIDPESARESLSKPLDLQISISSQIAFENEEIKSFSVLYTFSFLGTKKHHLYQIDLKNTDPVYRTINSMRNDERLNMLVGHCVHSIRLQEN